MIDHDLLVELATATAGTGVMPILEGQAAALVDALANTFVTDRTCQWWWESLAKPSKRIAYESNDGLAVLTALFEPKCVVVLFVTDDSPPPWPAYTGSMEGIITVLRGCRFFEYFLASPDGSWIIFDTHLNELVLVGSCAG